MIIGFAHISIGCVWGSGFSTHYSVPSSQSKWPLMRNRPLKHDIVINFPTVLAPIELVYHETGLIDEPSKIGIKGMSHLFVRARDAEVEKAFLSKLGIVEFNLVRIRSQIKRWGVNIEVIEDKNAPIDPALDIAGYSSLAFFSTNIASDREMLVQAGARDATPIFGVKLGKELKVCMLRSPEGTIIELIEVAR